MRELKTNLEALFGPDHPDVSVDLNNLAELLKDTKHVRKVRPLIRRVLQIFEENLGRSIRKVRSSEGILRF